jgi:hypothetical protein
VVISSKTNRLHNSRKTGRPRITAERRALSRRMKRAWQNPAERLIGSIRRQCLDYVIVLNPRHLRRILISCSAYYHGARPHLGLGKDAPIPRQVQGPGRGKVVASPEVGGLHHRYERRAS